MTSWQALAQFPEFATEIETAPTASGATPPAGAAASGTPTVRSGLPWDRRHELGFFNAFIETLKMVLTSPALAFSSMKTEGGLTEPLIYAVVGGSFGFIVYLLLTVAMGSFGIFADKHNALAGLMGMGFGTIFAIIFIPVFLVVGVFISAAIIHLCLMIVGGAKKSFETTFRVLSFSVGSAYPLMIIPVCGGLISGVWGLIVQCIGLARAHETDTGRAVLAVFLPLIVCCGGGLLLAMMFGVLGALTGHH
jgi:hypothetical protein